MGALNHAAGLLLVHACMYDHKNKALLFRRLCRLMGKNPAVVLSDFESEPDRFMRVSPKQTDDHKVPYRTVEHPCPDGDECHPPCPGVIEVREVDVPKLIRRFRAVVKELRNRRSLKA